ncbi:MAG: DUF4350 domain-containing protein, partial [Bacteroidales bacterium]
GEAVERFTIYHLPFTIYDLGVGERTNKSITMNKLLLIIAFVPGCLFSQQVADTAYHPEIPNPEYGRGQGPVVFIDEGHHNFHTKNGRYLPFSILLERDGYTVQEYEGLFDKNRLGKGKILVIANALNEKNVNDWFLPTPSAFTELEIEIVRDWVAEGGSLLLVADHMPMAGAAEELAGAFGFEFTNGFAMDTSARGPSLFYLKDQTLTECIITKGRNRLESVEKVASFTGQAFKIPADAVPILTFNRNHINLLPDTAWVFNDQTTKYSVEGWSQGAYKEYGRGRIVVFGEAAMFTAQLAGPDSARVGMNSAEARQNHQLLLNVIHWLDGKL